MVLVIAGNFGVVSDFPTVLKGIFPQISKNKKWNKWALFAFFPHLKFFQEFFLQMVRLLHELACSLFKIWQI